MLSVHSLNRIKAGFQVRAAQALSSSIRDRTHRATAIDGVVFGRESQTLNFEALLLHDLGKIGEVIVTEDDATFLRGKGDNIQNEKYSRNHHQ